MNKDRLRLVVVPSDPIAAYEAKGIAPRLELNYYNPTGMFSEVLALSPREEGERFAYSMSIVGINEADFSRFVQQFRPHVIRAYGGYWASDMVCRQRVQGIPVIVSVHDTNPRLLHPSVRFADFVLCTSKAVQERVCDMGVPLDRTLVLPNWIDTRLFQPQNSPNSLDHVNSRFPRGKRVLHVGRRSTQKNLDTLIRAMQLLPDEYYAVFVGQGDETQYKQLATSLGVDQRCYWVDRVPNDELSLWYSTCDCFCVPSRWEGFGVVFIEAAACGAPVITSNIAPMSEFFRHTINAHLVSSYENPARVADAIRAVCENTSYRSLLSEEAQKTGRLFSKETIQQQEAAVYRTVIERGPVINTLSPSYIMWKVKQTTLLRKARAITKGARKRMAHALRKK